MEDHEAVQGIGTPKKPHTSLESPGGGIDAPPASKIEDDEENLTIESDDHSFESFEDDIFYDAQQERTMTMA